MYTLSTSVASLRTLDDIIGQGGRHHRTAQQAVELRSLILCEDAAVLNADFSSNSTISQSLKEFANKEIGRNIQNIWWNGILSDVNLSIHYIDVYKDNKLYRQIFYVNLSSKGVFYFNNQCWLTNQSIPTQIPTIKSVQTTLAKTSSTPYTINITSTANISAPTSITSTTSYIGRWTDIYTSFDCKEISITKNGTKYEYETICGDGSSGTEVLTVKVVGGETRYYLNYSLAPNDYMVVESDGYLAFYDDQGLIFRAPPR